MTDQGRARGTRKPTATIGSTIPGGTEGARVRERLTLGDGKWGTILEEYPLHILH